MEENLTLNTIEETIDVVEEVNQVNTNTNSNNGLVVALGIGAVAILGTLVYKKVIKPRRKAKTETEYEVIIGDEETAQDEE